MVKPNHICKNKNCTNGTNGGRKHYYACSYCDKTQNYKSVACCKECYVSYMEQIKKARAKKETIDLYPERTDMSHEEVVGLVEDASVEDAKKKTLDELSAYAEEIESVGIPKTVDRINQEIDKLQKNNRKFSGKQNKKK